MDIIINRIKLQYPKVYEPVIFEGRKKYSVNFSTEEIKKLEETGVEPRKRDGTFSASSIYRPSIVCSNKSEYLTLVQALDVVRARNLSGDYFLRDVTADLHLQVYEYSNIQSSGVALGLVKIVIKDINELYENAFK